ncbi:SDR family oxidoreductase [Radicibacter daui]|uniref:SDR family oxidoreductase n=1 Tax=Radicibacter daui TaxID=3064829 RepID=UPI004046C909
MAEIRRKNVLVTGAAKRMGAAIAQALADDGWSVAVHYNHSRDDAEALVRRLELQGKRAVALQADLANEAEVETLVSRAREELGPLTALVNNASLFKRDEALTVTRESWYAHMDVNLRAPFILSQEFALQVPEATGGAIVNIVDQRVLNLAPSFFSYTLSKAGLWTMTQTLAMALAPGVRVNAVGPGPTIQNERQSDQHFRAQWESTALERKVEPEEVCAAVRYLLSAPSVTGQMIAVDSGEHLGYAQPKAGFIATE